MGAMEDVESMSISEFLQMIDAAGWVLWICPNRCWASVTWNDDRTVATCGSCGTASREGEVVRGGSRRGAES